MAEPTGRSSDGRFGWRRLRPRSLRVRTTALTVAIVGAALVLGGAALVVLLQNSLTDQVQTAARLRGEDVADVLESGTPPTQLAVNDEDDLIIQVIDDATGLVVTSSANVDGESVVADLRPGESIEVSSAPVGEDAFLVVASEAEAPSGRFTVLVGRSTEVVSESTNVLVLALAAGLPLLLVLVALTTWRTVGRTLAPVESIRHEVEEISAQELHRRVPAAAADQEIAGLAETMNRMLDRLEASHDRQRRFVSDASHELRSPVATIRQHAEVALAHPTETTAAELAEVVLAEDLRVQHLVEDLLLLARADERTLRSRPRAVDLDDLVFEGADRVRATTTLRVQVTDVSAGRVEGDLAQLRRVVRNLTDNAIRHADGAVSYSLSDDGDHVRLWIEDDGDGVPEADRERIFERFVRLDQARARDHGGSGLGLAIVREIVAAHGGQVSVATAPSSGARFEVLLPAAIST